MSKYNVLFIIVDSWNRNFVGCLNEKAREEGLTPNLDKFSEKCVTVLSAFSSGVRTSVSVLSILSGWCPCKYEDWYTSISKKRIVLSEILQNNEYFTSGYTSNPCTSSLRNYNKGYKIFRDDNVSKMKGLKLEAMLALKTLYKNPYSSAAEINSWVRADFNRNNSPYFAQVHYMDMHGPYISKNGWQFKNRISATKLWNKAAGLREPLTAGERENLISVYKDQMRYLDYHMGKLIEELDDGKTIVIITGDHGDVFGVRGYYGHPDIFCNEMINVPLFIKLPSEMNIAKRWKYPVSLMDLVPTILDVLGIRHECQFDGQSLLPFLEGKEEHRTKPIISEISRKYLCVIRGQWKLIGNYEKSSFELYNLEEDYGESNNLVNKRLDIFEELEEALQDHIRRNKPESKFGFGYAAKT